MDGVYNNGMAKLATENSGIHYRVDRAKTLHFLGYAGQHMDVSLCLRVDQAISLCEHVSTPSWVYRAFPVSEDEVGIRLIGTTLVLAGKDIRAHLHGARECAVMAATAGLANERELRRLSQANGLDAMLFDAASSALVEAVADACNAAIVAEARSRGLYAKWRFSPGYGDLPLGVQPVVLQVLSADKRLGITATESNMLIPAKSVTAFVGLFETPQDDKRSCANCSFAPYCELKEEGAPCYR